MDKLFDKSTGQGLKVEYRLTMMKALLRVVKCHKLNEEKESSRIDISKVSTLERWFTLKNNPFLIKINIIKDYSILSI